MCKKCNGNLKLISYKWNDDELIYKYQCDMCDEIVISTKEFEEETLKEMETFNELKNDVYEIAQAKLGQLTEEIKERVLHL